ncbi:MAG: hypothetical protein GYA55_13245, partial [SAR324 cluster bacterium]|nr:hypothetical protein [SAR324 cluster bacterium]
RRNVAFQDIAWEAVLESLRASAHLSNKDCEYVLARFIRKLKTPFNVQWLTKKSLSLEEHEVLLAMSEVIGADFFTITLERDINISLLEPKYHAEIELAPFVKDSASDEFRGRVTAKYGLSLFGYCIKITGVFQAILFYLLILVTGALLYALLIGILLYAIAVVILFIADPGLMTIAAIHHPSMLLVVLCLLVALAGLSGEAFRNIIHVLRSKVFWKVKI